MFKLLAPIALVLGGAVAATSTANAQAVIGMPDVSEISGNAFDLTANQFSWGTINQSFGDQGQFNPRSVELDQTGINPPVVRRDRETIEILEETGVCWQPLSQYGNPCPMVRFPYGDVRPAMIIGFHRNGPLTIEVDRLTYNFSNWLWQDYSPPVLEYVGDAEYAEFSREDWPPCPDNACDVPPRPEVHPVFSIPMPNALVNEDIEAVVLNRDGICITYTLPKPLNIPCHEVELPGGEIVSLNVGRLAGIALPRRVDMQRITFDGEHPLLDYGLWNFYIGRVDVLE